MTTGYLKAVADRPGRCSVHVIEQRETLIKGPLQWITAYFGFVPEKPCRRSAAQSCMFVASYRGTNVPSRRRIRSRFHCAACCRNPTHHVCLLLTHAAVITALTLPASNECAKRRMQIVLYVRFAVGTYKKSGFTTLLTRFLLASQFLVNWTGLASLKLL